MSSNVAIIPALCCYSTKRMQVVSPKVETKLFVADATYMISGVTGGLGRSLARWIAEQGGKHIVLASRSGLKHKQIPQLIAGLAKSGVQVRAERCDFAQRDQVKELFSLISDTMPPIKGVIHAPWVPMVSVMLVVLLLVSSAS